MLRPKDDVMLEDWVVHFYQVEPVCPGVVLNGPLVLLVSHVLDIVCAQCGAQPYWVIWRPFIISAGTAETHLFQYPPLPPASSLS